MTSHAEPAQTTATATDVKFHVVPSPHYDGLCGITARPIAKDEVLFVFVGPILRHEDIEDFTHCLEIGGGLYIGPSGEPCDYVNHGCQPNCRVTHEGGQVLLRALEDIPAGVELTFDYATIIWSDPTTFPCGCGAPRCRGRLGSFATLPQAVQEDYIARGMVPPFVLEAWRAAGCPSQG